MSVEKPSSAFGLALLGGIINILFAGGLAMGILPNVLGVDPMILAVVAVLSGIMMIVGGGIGYSNAARAKWGGYLVILGGLIAIFEPLGFILGLMGGSLLMRFRPAGQQISGSSVPPEAKPQS